MRQLAALASAGVRQTFGDRSLLFFEVLPLWPLKHVLSRDKQTGSGNLFLHFDTCMHRLSKEGSRSDALRFCIKYHLPDGVLGLQAEQEGGGDTVDIVHAHPVTLRSLFLGHQVTCRSIQEREL